LRHASLNIRQAARSPGIEVGKLIDALIISPLQRGEIICAQFPNADCMTCKEILKKHRLLIDIKHISDKVATARCSEKNPQKLLLTVVDG
jgi:hypothetical protein